MRIYFSGIGGVGLGPLAEIALDAGYQVVGSDMQTSLVTQQLEASGVEVSYSQGGQFLEQQHTLNPIDLVVYTAALPSDHPELLAARRLGIKTVKRDELLSLIISDKQLKLIAVAGTHGKTTTTGMLVWTLQQLGIPISYSVGTTISFGASGKYDPKSQLFIYECDEFDRNFLRFSPELTLITSIGYDHADSYPTKDDYLAAFNQFIDQSASIIMWQNDATGPIEPKFGSWLLHSSETAKLAIAGEHNRRNATLVLKAVEWLQADAFDLDATRQAVEAFPGTSRRFEKLADNLYTDYGHTPEEVAATLQMAKELSDQVVLVYQPHQNVRQHQIASDYQDAVFADAAEVYWLPTYLTREDPALDILTPTDLTKQLVNTPLHYAELDDELRQQINQQRQAGKLVLCMGAGSIDSWLRKQLQGES